MWVPLLKKKEYNKALEFRRTEVNGVREVFNFNFSFLLSSQIHENLTVEIRRDKHEKCSTRRGLRVGTKNKGFHQEFR